MTDSHLFYAGVLFAIFNGLLPFISFWVILGRHHDLERQELIERVSHSKFYLSVCIVTLIAGTILFTGLLWSYKAKMNEQAVELQNKCIKISADSIKCLNLTASNLKLQADITTIGRDDTIVHCCLDTINEVILNEGLLPTTATDSIIGLGERCIRYLSATSQHMDSSKYLVNQVKDSLMVTYPHLTTHLDTLENDCRMNLLESILKRQRQEQSLILVTIGYLRTIVKLAKENNMAELKRMLSRGGPKEINGIPVNRIKY